MVSGSRVDGGAQTLSAGVRKTIQSIKEIVGNHSDADIYVTLKETNMDPNETTQKLLNQDPFHEVKRRRDKKKENTVYKSAAEPRKNLENVGQGMKFHTFSDHNGRDHNGRRGGYTRSSFPGRSREFRVVRDNRVNQNTNKDTKPALQQCSTSANEQVIPNASEKSSTGTSDSQKPLGGRTSSQALNGPTDSHIKLVRDTNSGGNNIKDSTEKRATVPNTVVRGQTGKQNDSRSHPAAQASSNSVVGLYSSSSDPVHVPSSDSRSSAAVGAIRREVGVVGVRRQSSDSSQKHSSIAGSSFSNSLLVRDNTYSAETVRHPSVTSKGNPPSQTTTHETTTPTTSVGRPFLNNQYGNRSHQQPAGHHKAFQVNKEWKPKSSQKSSVITPGVIGSTAKSVSPSADNPSDNSKDLKSEAAKLQDKLSQLDIYENQNVIIAEHIRVAETERCLLTFGSIGTAFQAVGSVEESGGSASLSASALESSNDDISGSKQVDKVDDHIANSGSHSPESAAAAAEHQLPDKNERSSPQSLDSYSDIGIIHENSRSYAPPESQQQPEPSELPSFSAYDPQTGYDIPYFRSTMDESLRGQGLPSPHEGLSSYAANSIPASTIAMMQQQQQQPSVAQMYPQVHVSHFGNLMPYRQFLSPVYVPPMAMPGYSNNPAYPHPSNGNSYLLMPGGSSHPNASSLKYGIQQFKPLPNGSPTGFGNFTSPNGYAINTPGVVGSATGLEDSSRLKYKDGNLYVPNPQAETSEIWIQNPRELPGMQSAPYYNMAGQTPHAAYMPSHTGHASFNAAAAAAAQSSHMQYPGLYHPQQPAALANPHHLAPAMGGNVGVGVAAAAPGAQVGAYQQPQLSHLNWTTNF